MSLSKHKSKFTNGTQDGAHLTAAAGAYPLIMLSGVCTAHGLI